MMGQMSLSGELNQLDLHLNFGKLWNWKQLVSDNSSLSSGQCTNYIQRDWEGHSGLINWQTDRDEKSHLRTLWIRDRNGRWREIGKGRRWGPQKKRTTATQRIKVRKREDEQEQGDITHSEMAVMTEPKEGNQPPYQCDTSNEVAMCCSGISASTLWSPLLPLIASCEQSKSMLKYIVHSSAVTVSVQVWKLAIRSNGGPFAVTLETSSGLWSYFVLCCLPESSLDDRRGRWWGERGKD